MSVVQFILLPFNAFFDFIFSVINSNFGFMVMSFLVIYSCIVIPFWHFMGVKN